MILFFCCFLTLLLLDQADIIRIKCLRKLYDKLKTFEDKIDKIFIKRKPITHIPPIQIRIQEMDSILYAYRVDNNLYLTQATNPIELLQNLYLLLDTSYISVDGFSFSEEDGSSFIEDYIIK